MTESSACPHCGRHDMVLGVNLVKSVEPGWVGLHYKLAGPLLGTEPLRADLCQNCGTVVRFWVQNSRRRWLTK